MRPTPRAAAALATLMIVGAAGAEWPADPAAPLPVGEADDFVTLRHAAAADGATWIAWIDALCLGELRVQRIDAAGGVLAEGGMVIPHDGPLCGTTGLQLAVTADGAAIVHRGGTATDQPIHRVEPDGALPWGAGRLMSAWIGGLEALLPLDGGDVLVGGHAGTSVFASRRDATGEEVWTTAIPTPYGPNKRLVALVTDDADGAYAIFDMPLAYTRIIAAAHVDAAGVVTWPAPIVVVPADPSSSRHSDPVAIADGRGGVAIVFVTGHETAGTPVPLRYQRLLSDGTLAFGPEGRRLSLGAARQFDPILARDAGSGDLIVTWRDGPLTGQTLRGQRIGLDGTRQSGETGVAIAALGAQGSSRYATTWEGATLAATVARPTPLVPSVMLHRLDGSGAAIAAPVALSGETDAGAVALAVAGTAVTASWQEAIEGAPSRIVAQRINADGTLGTVPADLDGDGLVGFADLLALLAAWGPCAESCAADLDDDGVIGFGDLLVLLAAWS